MRHIPRLAGARVVCALFAAGVLAAGTASAASLTVNSAGLAAEQLPVVRCDTSVTVSWTTEYNAGLDAMTVDVVSLSGIDAECDGQVFKVTLADGSNAALGSGSYLDPAGAGGQVDPGGGTNQTVDFDFSGQDVRDTEVVLAASSIAN